MVTMLPSFISVLMTSAALTDILCARSATVMVSGTVHFAHHRLGRRRERCCADSSRGRARGAPPLGVCQPDAPPDVAAGLDRAPLGGLVLPDGDRACVLRLLVALRFARPWARAACRRPAWRRQAPARPWRRLRPPCARLPRRRAARLRAARRRCFSRSCCSCTSAAWRAGEFVSLALLLLLAQFESAAHVDRRRRRRGAARRLDRRRPPAGARRGVAACRA